MKVIKIFLVIILSTYSSGVFSMQINDSTKIKISQMLIFGINDAKKVLQEDSMLEAYSNMNLGGIILFEKNISKKRSEQHLKMLTDEIQLISKIPSFIAIDEEGGKVNRLKPIYGFHETKSAKFLGDMNNFDTTYHYARLTSSLLKELGININFAPTVDLAINRENPVIYKAERSYGERSRKSISACTQFYGSAYAR